MKIQVLHKNRSGAARDGYLDAATFTEVYEFDDPNEFDFWELAVEHVIRQWLGATPDRDVWHLHPCTIDYLFRGNRPLRAGDVIAIDGAHCAVGPGDGIEELDADPARRPIVQPGTVPFMRPSLDLRDGAGEALVNLSRWAREALRRLPELDDWDAQLLLKAVLALLSAILPADFRDDPQAALDRLRASRSQAGVSGAAHALEPEDG